MGKEERESSPASRATPGAGEGPLLGCDRTYQVALLLPHAGGADHVILFPSPVSKSTEKIVR